MPYKNLELKKEYNKNYRIKNRKTIREKSKVYARLKRLDPVVKIKNAEYTKQWRLNNPSYKACPIKAREYLLKTRYGIDISIFNKMFKSQKGLCKICNTKKATDVDHCHTTLEVRGLLCTSCNRSLGFVDKFKKEIKDYLNE